MGYIGMIPSQLKMMQEYMSYQDVMGIMDYQSQDHLHFGGTGAWLHNVFECRINSGAASGNAYYCYWGNYWHDITGGVTTTWRFSWNLRTHSSTPVNCNFWSGCWQSQPSLNNLVKHIGFFIESGYINATNANGSARTITDTGLFFEEGGVFIKLSYKYTAGRIDFFVDGELVATHTTNVPVFENFKFYFEIKTRAAASKYCYVGPVMAVRNYSED